MSNLNTKLKVGDLVKVITGKYSGGKRKSKKGEKRMKVTPLIDYISHIDHQKQVVYLKKASQKKYDKSTAETKKKSELKEIMVPIHISNVAYWLEDKKKTTKIGLQEMEKKEGAKIEKVKVRVSRKYKDKKGNNLLIN